jgi:hypothetical protein
MCRRQVATEGSASRPEFFRAFTVTLIERWEQVEAAAGRERRAPD